MAVIAGHQRKLYKSPWMGATRVFSDIKQDKHMTNKRLYGAIPSVSSRIAVRKMELADHWHQELSQASTERTSHTYFCGRTQKRN